MSSDLKRLKAARHKVAQLLLTDRIYAPIFERLEHEVAALEAQDDLVERARALASLYKATG